MLAIFRMVTITAYWIVLICFNIRNFRHMSKESRERNRFVYALIFVNAVVIFCTILEIFTAFLK